MLLHMQRPDADPHLTTGDVANLMTVILNHVP